MKALKTFSALVLMLTLGMTATAQYDDDEKLNLPGDNLNLYAVMKLFQESETLEGFERSLNAEDSKINNLDLNGNNLIDYIRVIDNKDGDDHTIVLQVAISERENQDVAVITVFKDSKGQVQIQMIGDEELYGKDYIIEPYYDEATGETANPGYTGNTRIVNGETVVVTKTTYVEVQSWPVVRYIYTPTYVVWRSPWYWDYYPSYWRPWRPYYWDYYYGYHYNWYPVYYGHYRHWHHYRYPRYHDYYYSGHRVHSTTVRNYRDSGRYRDTYSRPDLRKEGSAEFTRRHPEGVRPSGRPAGSREDNVKPGTRPSGNGNTARPAEGRPSGRPEARPNENRPAGKPEARPSKPAESRPATRPSKQNETKPAARPSGNGNTARPANDSRPASRPAVNPPSERKETARPSGRSEVSKPSGRSENSRPSGRSEVSRPAGRSEASRPSGSNTRQQSVAPSKSGHSQPQGRSASQGSSKSSSSTSGGEKRGNGR